MRKLVYVFLAEGFEEIEAVTIIDVLRRAELHVKTVGLTHGEVKGAHDIVVKSDILLSDISGLPDAVVLPGGMPGAENLGKSSALGILLVKMSKEGKTIGAICAAPAMALAPHGILRGRKATCYPGFEDKFGRDVTFVTDRVINDRGIITSRGPGSALEFALALVRELSGKETSEKLSDAMLVPTRDESCG